MGSFERFEVLESISDKFWKASGGIKRLTRSKFSEHFGVKALKSIPATEYRCDVHSVKFTHKPFQEHSRGGFQGVASVFEKLQGRSRGVPRGFGGVPEVSQGVSGGPRSFSGSFRSALGVPQGVSWALHGISKDIRCILEKFEEVSKDTRGSQRLSSGFKECSRSFQVISGAF